MSEQTGAYQGDLTAATTTAVGGVIKLLNPEGEDLIIPSGGFGINVTTVSTGAATLDIGIDDGGDVSNDTLLDGVDVNAATGVFDNGVDGGTNGGAVLWPAGYYLVATASATTAGMVGTYWVRWIRVEE
jgi:hypothetical protein